MAVRSARIPEEVPIIRKLFQEFADELVKLVNLTLQNFEQELATLPGYYSPPEGDILVSCDGDDVTGCIAFRQFAENICEMKRLYVRPEYRRRGLGRRLTMAAIEGAKNAGYQQMYLEAMSTLPQTVTLYKACGFKEIPSYCSNPDPDGLYFCLELQKKTIEK